MTTAPELLKNVGAWTLDPDRSSFEFKSKNFWGLASVKGRFTEFGAEGNVEVGGNVSGRVDIEAASVTTGIKKRDNHLRSADFFDAENHPKITVTVHGVDPADGDKLDVRAEMSIRGNTVALPMQVNVEVLDDGAVRLTTTTAVNREQLGVNGNMVGMIPPTTTLSADAVFNRAS